MQERAQKLIFVTNTEILVSYVYKEENQVAYYFTSLGHPLKEMKLEK